LTDCGGDEVVIIQPWANRFDTMIEVNGLVPGLHKYTLTVEDRFGNTENDIIVVSVFADSEDGPSLPGKMIPVGVGIGADAAVLLPSSILYNK